MFVRLSQRQQESRILLNRTACPGSAAIGYINKQSRASDTIIISSIIINFGRATDKQTGAINQRQTDEENANVVVALGIRGAAAAARAAFRSRRYALTSAPATTAPVPLTTTAPATTMATSGAARHDKLAEPSALYLRSSERDAGLASGHRALGQWATKSSATLQSFIPSARAAASNEHDQATPTQCAGSKQLPALKIAKMIGAK